jgi:hypothetical protein
VPSARRPVSSMGDRAQPQRHRVHHGPGMIISTIYLSVEVFATTTIASRISGDSAAVARAAHEERAPQRLLPIPSSVPVYPKAHLHLSRRLPTSTVIHWSLRQSSSVVLSVVRSTEKRVT